MRDDAEVSIEDADYYRAEIARTLSFSLNGNTDEIVKRGLANNRTRDMAIRAIEKQAEGSATQYAFIMFCTALGHDFMEDDEGGPRFCLVCGIREGQEPEMGWEDEDF